jgi:hypothetical protein
MEKLTPEAHMRGFKFASVVSVAFLIAGCGGDGTRLVTPDNVSPTLGGLTIAGADGILTGSPTSYTASATFSNGTVGNVTPDWRSSNSAIATVDASGHVEGRSQGTFSLTASYQGREVSKSVQVVNNYGGRWDGQYRVLSCQDDGDLSDHDGGWCRTVYVTGNVYRIVVDLAQDPADLTSVAVTLGDEAYRGTVGNAGALTWGGVADLFDWDHENVVGTREIHWDTILSGNGVMSGSFRENYKSIGFRNGTARMEYEVLTMTRTAASAAARR